MQKLGPENPENVVNSKLNPLAKEWKASFKFQPENEVYYPPSRNNNYNSYPAAEQMEANVEKGMYNAEPNSMENQIKRGNFNATGGKRSKSKSKSRKSRKNTRKASKNGRKNRKQTRVNRH